MNRTIFLVDGFNLYHSVVEASRDLKGASTKWLDINSLCNSYLHVIGNNAKIEQIYYFSALAYHLQKTSPSKIKNHKLFIKALHSVGVISQLGRFKKKTSWCPKCKSQFKSHEEKETDVAISTQLLESLIKNECDTAVLITGDTDLAPAVRSAHHLFPKIDICFGFPYKRKNKELAKISSKSFYISKESYTKHQFPIKIILPNNIELVKPPKW
jgi:uncharacterized LabA/DUF88 family protein